MKKRYIVLIAGIAVSIGLAGLLTVKNISDFMAFRESREKWRAKTAEQDNTMDIDDDREYSHQEFAMYNQLPEEADADEYLILFQKEGIMYSAERGDTLESITIDRYGTKSVTGVVQALNPELPRDGEIEMGTEFFLPDCSYIRKQKGSLSGVQSPAYSYDLYRSWKVGYDSQEDCLDAFWEDGTDIKLSSNITERKYEKNQFSEDWEAFQKKVKESRNENCSDPAFEFYTLESGLDLYFYTFTYDAEEEQIYYAVAYILGEYYQAEFIGMMPDTETDYADMADITRYIAATFAERDAESGRASLKSGPYTGEEDWAWEYLHNPFALAEKRHGTAEEAVLKGKDYPVTFKSEDWETIVRGFCAVQHDIEDDELDIFREEGLKASDIAWVTELTIKEHPVPGRDTLMFNDYTYDEADIASLGLYNLEDLAVFPNLRSITLEIGSIEDYSGLAQMEQLREISISSGYETYELDWITQMPQLESFTYRLSNSRNLSGAGYDKEGGTTFDGGEGKGRSELDPDIFRKCRNLKYLELETTGMLDLSFLEDLEHLYTFRLYGEDQDSEAARKRAAQIAEGDYPQIRCLVMDDEWLRNPA